MKTASEFLFYFLFFFLLTNPQARTSSHLVEMVDTGYAAMQVERKAVLKGLCVEEIMQLSVQKTEEAFLFQLESEKLSVPLPEKNVAVDLWKSVKGMKLLLNLVIVVFGVVSH